MANRLQASRAALARIAEIRADAIKHVVGKLYAMHGMAYEQFGEAGQRACREDIGFHFDFLEPALEFGDPAPLADYLCWLAAVLEARNVPASHVPLSLTLAAEYLCKHLAPADSAAVQATIETANAQFARRRTGTGNFYIYRGKAWPTCKALEQALIYGHSRQVRRIVDTALQESLERGGGLPDVAVHLVQPALYNIGLGWQDNRISVAQEHLATAGAHTALAQAFVLQEPEPSTGRRALLACLEGNQHALGLRMVSDALTLAGWDAQFLGANTPVSSVMRQIQVFAPHLVGFSATLPMHLRPLKAAISHIREALGPSCPVIMVGGLTVNQLPGMAAALGADFTCTDAKSVVAAANSRIQRQAQA